MSGLDMLGVGGLVWLLLSCAFLLGMVWAGRDRPTVEQLRRYLMARRHEVEFRGAVLELYGLDGKDPASAKVRASVEKHLAIIEARVDELVRLEAMLCDASRVETPTKAPEPGLQ